MSDDGKEEPSEQTPKNLQRERSYGCPCGKRYLSYPALFTHIKQKHDGKNPGQLIKPKNDKARGRPCHNQITTPEEDRIRNFDCKKELAEILETKKVNFTQKISPTEQKRSCASMAIEFIDDLAMPEEHQKVLQCFFCYIRSFLNTKYNSQFWEKKHPDQIILSGNDIVGDLNKFSHIYPLSEEIVTNLLYVLSRWMFQHRWTDHLLDKASEKERN